MAVASTRLDTIAQNANVVTGTAADVDDLVHKSGTETITGVKWLAQCPQRLINYDYSITPSSTIISGVLSIKDSNNNDTTPLIHYDKNTSGYKVLSIQDCVGSNYTALSLRSSNDNTRCILSLESGGSAVNAVRGSAFAAAGMPSGAQIDLSVPSEAATTITAITIAGTTTVPYSGWVSCVIVATSVSSNHGLQCCIISRDMDMTDAHKRPISAYFTATEAGNTGSLYLPVKKGQILMMQTYNSPTISQFHFMRADAALS